MKVVVVIALVLTLTTLIESRHTKDRKQSEIVKTPQKRQYDPSYHSTCCQHVTPPVQNCCQAPNPPTCCTTTVPDYSTVQGCCSAVVQPHVQPQPQPPKPQNCCQKPNPPPCCLNLHLKAGEQKNITTTNGRGQNFILNVKLIPIDSNPCTTATTPTTKPSPSPTPTGSTKATTESGSTTVLPTGPSSPKPNPQPADECGNDALEYHNEKRAIHNAPAMSLDPAKNKFAQMLANKYANQKLTTINTEDQRVPKRPFGINIGVQCFHATAKPFSCKRAVSEWYREVDSYDWESPKYYSEERHFTQMVWKSSQKLSIGYATFMDSTNRKCHVVVAVYNPPGNVDGGYAENVQKGSYE